MGMVHHHDFEIEAIEQRGPLADVHLRLKASVPEVEVRGHRLAQPQRELRTTERWLWVDGSGYREMHEESTGKRYTRY